MSPLCCACHTGKTTGAWQGPSQLEWQQLQLQLSEQQQLVVHLQEQAASSAAAFVALQVCVLQVL